MYRYTTLVVCLKIATLKKTELSEQLCKTQPLKNVAKILGNFEQ